MTDQNDLDVLNVVLGATAKSPYARLWETGAFRSSGETEEEEALQQILDDEKRFAAELAELIQDLGGVPLAFGVPDFQAGRMHYLDVHFLLTEVLRWKEPLLAVCESALEQLSGSTAAYQMVSRMAAAHREHLQTLQRLTGA